MVIMIAVTILMRTQIIAPSILAHRMNLDATMADVYLKHGSVIMKMIVRTEVMKSIVNTLHVLKENLLA